VQYARRLRRRSGRDRESAYLAEGPTVVSEALKLRSRVRDVFVVPDDPRIQQVVELAGELGVPVHEVTPSVLDSICDTATPQGVAAVIGWERRSIEDLLSEKPFVVAIAAVRDPGNAGTLLRSALAAGATGFVVAKGSVDPLHPKTVRASAGAVLQIPVLRDEDLGLVLSQLRRAGVLLVGADPMANVSAYDLDLTGPIALILGNESWGLPEDIRNQLDSIVGIPMPGPAESLNVATAGSILMFEIVRQRRLSSAVQ
jgi:TrmH family RNA methyltransferase